MTRGFAWPGGAILQGHRVRCKRTRSCGRPPKVSAAVPREMSRDGSPEGRHGWAGRWRV
ncbi:hypothetical protein PA05_1204 [Cutibacterium acnes P05]|nr:hypothetical protein [Cutibacterium acnes P05]